MCDEGSWTVSLHTNRDSARCVTFSQGNDSGDNRTTRSPCRDQLSHRSDTVEEEGQHARLSCAHIQLHIVELI
ncbi:hypothetical protein F2P81_025997 [Scophthalmus maximus]|uniref:Uncharacterized protein n=1 Tax=Scophthalmus maximus TaxID=52904 RepID=A0A6A4RQU1_SCOMX|nr:hypothetical protein F2P81_025997 [Scophthalmus maximus]